MGEHHSHQFLPMLDTRDPDFPRQGLLWASEARREMMEVVAATRRTIDSSRAFMAEVDRLLTGK